MKTSRRASVYLAILVVVAAVTVLALAGVTLRRQIHTRARTGNEASAVRRLALSGAELSVHVADRHRDAFQELAEAGTLFSGLDATPGTINAVVTDADTDSAVTANTDRYRVVSEGAVGQARSRIGLTLERQDDDLTALLKSMNAQNYWPLDEVNLSTAEDAIGDQDGTYSAPAAAGADTHKHGNPAPRIDWITETIRVPHHASFEIGDGTLCFWVRFDAVPTSGGVMAAAVVKERSPTSAQPDLAVYLTDDSLNYKMDNNANNGATIRCSSSRITQGQWHFITIGWGDSGMELHVDGVERAEDDDATLDLDESGSRPANTQDWYFGIRNKPYSSYTQFWPTYGSVARVILFDRRLADEEIAALMAASSLPGPIELEPGSFARVVE